MPVTNEAERSELRKQLREAAGGTPPDELTPEQNADAFDYIYRSRLPKIIGLLKRVHGDGERAECWEERYAQDVSTLLYMLAEPRESLMPTDLMQENNRIRTALRALLRQYEVDWAKWTNSPASFTEIIQAREALRRKG